MKLLATQLATASSIEEVQQCIKNGEKLCLWLASENEFHSLFTLIHIPIFYKHAAAAAERLGLVNEAARLRRIESSLTSFRAELWVSDLVKNQKLRRRAGLIASEAIIDHLVYPLPLGYNIENLKPERLANYAIFSRFAWGLAAALLMLICGILGSAFFFGSQASRQCSQVLVDLLKWRDWLWILLLGFGFPMLWYSLILMTPMSVREYNMTMGAARVPFQIQYGGVLLMIILATWESCKWRLELRVKGLGLRKTSYRNWVFVVLAGAALPLAGFCIEPSTFMLGKILSLSCLGIAAMWLLYSLMDLLLFSKNHLSKQCEWRVLVSVLPFGVCLISVCVIPLLHARERYWMSQDTLLTLPTSEDYREPWNTPDAVKMREELLKCLNSTH